jgi:hypothetical protein
MEHLLRQVRIHGGRDPGNEIEVPVDETAQPYVVLHGAAAAAARHEQL